MAVSFRGTSPPVLQDALEEDEDEADRAGADAVAGAAEHVCRGGAPTTAGPGLLGGLFPACGGWAEARVVHGRSLRVGVGGESVRLVASEPVALEDLRRALVTDADKADARNAPCFADLHSEPRFRELVGPDPQPADTASAMDDNTP